MREALRFEKPLYTVTEAASYVGVPRSTFDTWAPRGYRRTPKNRTPVYGDPLLTSVSEYGLSIPFVGLVEGMVLAAFHETGLPLQRIRPALDRLRAGNGLEHALASEHLYTDGAELFYDYAQARGDKQLGLLTVIDWGQRAFHEVIARYLTGITYEDGWAIRLILPITAERLLLVDPGRAFGHPILAEVYPEGADQVVPDVQWIRDADSAERVALTKDERITRYAFEQQALTQSTLRIFAIGNQHLSGLTMASYYLAKSLGSCKGLGSPDHSLTLSIPNRSSVGGRSRRPRTHQVTDDVANLHRASRRRRKRDLRGLLVCVRSHLLKRARCCAVPRLSGAWVACPPISVAVWHERELIVSSRRPGRGVERSRS